ncbi:MAG: hypothetical protein ACK43N_19725, partial [Pirellulaceae bacterium]
GNLPEVRSDNQDASHRYAGSRGRMDPAGSASRPDRNRTTEAYRHHALPMAKKRTHGAAQGEGASDDSPSHRSTNHHR